MEMPILFGEATLLPPPKRKKYPKNPTAPIKKTMAMPKNHQSADRASPIARGATMMPAIFSCVSTKSSPTVLCDVPSGRRVRSWIFGESEREYIARLKRSIFSFSCSERSIAKLYHGDGVPSEHEKEKIFLYNTFAAARSEALVKKRLPTFFLRASAIIERISFLRSPWPRNSLHTTTSST